ncbi:MAG: hypothetical protein K2G35_10515 [Duncaniella sp.]|nr:hypothetical protein [Duncaniella sp.]
MNTHCSFAVRLLVGAACLLTAWPEARADIDKKYFAKVAAEVWAMDLPGFNPTTPLTDSIFEGQNAAYISRYVGVTSDYNNELSAGKTRVFGLTENNITSTIYLRRDMVKINDAAAAEDFTEFTVLPESKESVSGVELARVRPAFGARIIKPDGSVTEVDMNEALTQTGGKKDKEEVEYKIAIPGLAPGDVLDYFYYTDYFFDELIVPSIPVNILAKYPTHLFTLDVKVDPRLCMEYGAYNGAPAIKTFEKTADGKNLLFLQLENIGALDEKLPYFSAARQMPMMELYILNNNSRLSYVPQKARNGGMRYANHAFVVSDIASAIFDCKTNDKVTGEANGMVKSWLKAHPDATPEQTAEAAWTALRYCSIKSSDKITERQFVKMFVNLMAKLQPQTDARVAAGNSRKQIAVGELAHYSDAHYFVVSGGRTFFPPNAGDWLPGEIPAWYDGEEYILFSAMPDNARLDMSARNEKLPAGRAADNVVTVVTEATFDPADTENLEVSARLSATGSSKASISEGITFDRFVADQQEYLGLKPSRLKYSSDSKEQEEKALSATEEFVKMLWNSDEATLESYEIEQSGTTPASPSLVKTVKGKVPGAITDAGDHLMVKLGQLTGKQHQITGAERTREISILSRAPHRVDNTIIFTIPDGYELVEGSLDDLRKSISSPVGSFRADATLDGRTVKIRTSERYNRSILPASSWDDMLRLLDAAHEYSEAAILIAPAN